MHDSPRVDQDVVQEMFDVLGESFLDVLQAFKNEVPGYVLNLEAYHRANNIPGLIYLTHNIKSSCGNIGFLRLYEYCKNVEDCLQKDASKNVDKLIEDCQKELKLAMIEIDNLMVHE